MIFTLEIFHHLVDVMSISRNIFPSNLSTLLKYVGGVALRHTSPLDSLELTDSSGGCDGALLAGPAHCTVHCTAPLLYSEEIHRAGCSGCCKYRMLTRVDSAGNSIVVVTWGDLCKPLIEHNLLGIEYLR